MRSSSIVPIYPKSHGYRLYFAKRKIGRPNLSDGQASGTSRPEDVSIVSFDDPTSIVEEFSIFTHVKQFEWDMGYQVAGKLLEVLRDQREVRSYSKLLIEPELIIRQTSGHVPQT